MYVCLPMVNIDVFGHRSTFYSNIFVHDTKPSTWQYFAILITSESYQITLILKVFNSFLSWIDSTLSVNSGFETLFLLIL